MDRMRGVLVAAVGAALVASGCGSSSSGGGAASVPMADVPAKLAQVVCDDEKTCAGDAAAIFFNGEDCVQRETVAIEQGEFSGLQAAIDAKRVSYHGDKVDGCIAALTGKGCEIFGKRLPAACSDVFQGTVADGGTCTLNEECVGDSVCVNDTVCPGKCGPKVAAGGKCDADDDCQDGLACSDASYTCVKIPGAGESCGGGGADCGAGLICVGADPNAKTCATFASVFAAKEGDGCDLAAGKLCQTGLSCEATDLTTQPPTETCVKPVSSGAACKAAAPDECPAGEYCAVAKGTFAGTCTPVPAANAACGNSALSSTVCAPYTRCDPTALKCVPLQQDGGSCDDDSICYTGHCESGKCAAMSCGS